MILLMELTNCKNHTKKSLVSIFLLYFFLTFLGETVILLLLTQSSFLNTHTYLAMDICHDLISQPLLCDASEVYCTEFIYLTLVHIF